MKDEVVNGHPIRCYDRESDKTTDRYTVIYMNDKYVKSPLMGPRAYTVYGAVGMSAYPFHPQGFGQHCTAMPGKHLGKRIKFADLPADCQKLVQQDTKQ